MNAPSVVASVWSAAGEPEPDWTGKAKTARTAPDQFDGQCALTGAIGPCVDLRHVLSDLWSGWDHLRHLDRSRPALSIPAAWAFRLRVAMQRPHICDADGFREATPDDLYHRLLRPDTAMVVTVPQSRQKHLLPFAVRGTVRTDDETLPWGAVEAARLGAYAVLRGDGFGETALAEPAPRWPILQRAVNPASVVALWPELDPWRAHPAYLDVAARATRQPKEPS